ncbi:hypothetical protein KIN20_027354 [Parelaphostrongylus tenuis]|uniref:Uncharacterized protein n=1 Tax=Parelaphostrongylus tenuis TaxID=148309 RepID=A0AAD5WDT4_PARTN|nr:hypothetical protein KIN20_027354 [Parelaphostrongylus tenuis]
MVTPGHPPLTPMREPDTDWRLFYSPCERFSAGSKHRMKSPFRKLSTDYRKSDENLCPENNARRRAFYEMHDVFEELSSTIEQLNRTICENLRDSDFRQMQHFALITKHKQQRKQQHRHQNKQELKTHSGNP